MGLGLQGVSNAWNFQSSRNETSAKAPDRSICVFETVELELGLSTTEMETNYQCPIFLHKDESNSGRYFASHSAGVHSITVPVVDDLQKFLSVKDGWLKIADPTSNVDKCFCASSSR